MKKLLPFFFVWLACVAFSQTDVSALRVPKPASFEKEVRARLATRPELLSLLSGIVIDDAGTVAGHHYFNPHLQESGEVDAYEFRAHSQDLTRPAILTVHVRFTCPTKKTSPTRISVSVSDAEPQDLKHVDISKKEPNQSSEPMPPKRHGSP